MDSSLESNLQLQDDELIVLKSIYEDEWKTEDDKNRSYSYEFKDGKTVVATLYVTFPPQYPRESPPVYQLSAPYLTHSEKNQLHFQLQDCYLKHIQEPVVFSWIWLIKDFLKPKDAETEPNEEKQKEVGSSLTNKEFNDELKPVASAVYEIVYSSIITDRKSTFQGCASRITSIEDVKNVLSQLHSNKKVDSATHNVVAYRIKGSDSCVVQDYDDDGEAQAGRRLLHLLQMMDVFNVLVVVTRWYGGILLGPDRFKHYNNAAKEALTNAAFVTSNKKKSKR